MASLLFEYGPIVALCVVQGKSRLGMIFMRRAYRR